MTFQEMVFRLNDFWAKQGCAILQPYDMEVGAGTMHPATTFRGCLALNHGTWPIYSLLVDQPTVDIR